MGAGAAAGTAAAMHPGTRPTPMLHNRFEERGQAHRPPPVVGATASTAHEPRPWAVWLSLDPRKSQLDLYPQLIAWTLEAAFQAGEKAVDLGDSFHGVGVRLKGDMRQINRNGGSRDVMRLESMSRDADINVPLRVIQTEHGWRFAPSAHARNSEERSVIVPRHLFVPISLDKSERLPESDVALAPKGENSSESQEDSPETLEGKEPLWEWCRWDGITIEMLGSLPEEAWGMYSQEQNEAIESALHSGSPSVEIEVGIRKYLLIFGPRRNLARQEDPLLRKRRLVRRRLVPQGEHAKLVKSITEATGLGNGGDLEQEECAICCAEFAETATMPVVELPDCKHIFHRACVQHEADDNKPCPVCRAVVDWKSVLR